MWCTASGAKFNKGKTVAIPIGTPSYRESVATHRRMADDAPYLPDDIRIAPDSEATRILGAWVGNNICSERPWTPVLDRMRSALKRWGSCRPTLRGKRLIVQMIVRGMSQYLTKVQGMPKPVEAQITQLVRTFIWGDVKVPPVSLDTLQQHPAVGGIKLLDLPARNDAIELTWLASYMAQGEARPAWAFLADRLLARSILVADRTMPENTRINMFVQRWGVGTHQKSPLPPCLKRLVAISTKYNASLSAINPASRLKASLPIWHHVGADSSHRRALRSKEGKCLLTKHRVSTVADVSHVASQTEHVLHTPGDNRCACPLCSLVREETHCKHPAACATLAGSLRDSLGPKWHPDTLPPVDNLTLTRHRKEKNRRARLERKAITFNPSVTSGDALDEGFRIFTDPVTLGAAPAFRTMHQVPNRQPRLVVYTDGSCIHNGDANAWAGAGVWFGRNDARNLAIRVPGVVQSNQAGEILAIQQAAARAPPDTQLHIISDSQYAIDGLTIHLAKWVNRGWLGVANAALFRSAAYHLQARSAPTTFQWVKGHSNDEGNDGADTLAGIGARKPTPDDIDLAVPASWNTTGVKMSALTQAIAYLGVRATRKARHRKGDEVNLERTYHYVHDHLSRRYHTNSQIWQALRHKDVTRKISDFLWKVMHNSLRVGRYWSHIPGYEGRATCNLCDEEESI
jgi:ribonuclease HI